MLRGIRLCSLGALLLSAAAAVDTYGGGGHGSTFCGSGSGCDAVRHSGVGEAIGGALPALGIVGFSALILATLMRGRSVQLAALSGALTAAVAGVVLLALQAFAVGAFCRICVGVDLLAIAAGALAVPLLRKPSAPQAGALERGLWAAGIALAIGTPFAYAATKDTQLPAYVASVGEPGKLSVVEISDFECPHCRAMHPHLKRALADFASEVHFVRKSYPLPSHTHARDAARAYTCAEHQGRGEAMADVLFKSNDLSPQAARQAAVALGLDEARFVACVEAPETDRAIDQQMARIREAGFEGLPTVFIGDRVLVGFDPSRGAERYREAIAAELAGGAARSPWQPWIITVSAAVLMFALAYWAGRLRGQAA